MQLLCSFVESTPLSRRLRAWLESLTPAQLAVLEHVLDTPQLVDFVELWRDAVGPGGELVMGAPGAAPTEPSTRCTCGRCLSTSQRHVFGVIGVLVRSLFSTLTPAQREALRECVPPGAWSLFERSGLLPPVGQA
ncbi:MAG: hypothetical protein IT378_08335 [Sandaracinaceae bacterium]|nr:hypothetical protein [Sandaracinaceae bacterium]